MSGKLTIKHGGQSFKLEDNDIWQLIHSLCAAFVDGDCVTFGLYVQPQSVEPKEKGAFYFVSERYTQRLSCQQQRELALLAAATLSGKSHCWPKPLAGVSATTSQPNSPFPQWLKKEGAEVNGD